MRGRDENWAGEFATKPAAELVAAAREEDFAGILLDRLAAEDRADAMEAELRAAAGTEPERSSNGRWAFFRL